jgi:hypothetical protein
LSRITRITEAVSRDDICEIAPVLLRRIVIEFMIYSLVQIPQWWPSLKMNTVEFKGASINEYAGALAAASCSGEGRGGEGSEFSEFNFPRYIDHELLSTRALEELLNILSSCKRLQCSFREHFEEFFWPEDGKHTHRRTQRRDGGRMVVGSIGTL